MARIDSLLGIVIDQNADELRLGGGREPKMLARGTPKRFVMPPIDDETLRHLLGEILSAPVLAAIARAERPTTDYTTATGVSFEVTLAGRPEGLEVVFRRVSGAARASAPSPVVVEAPISSRRPSVTELAAPTPGSLAGSAYVRSALGMGASDLHLIDGDVPTVRVDGKLRRLGEEVVSDVLSALQLDPSIASAERAVDFATSAGGEVRARVHIYRADGRRAVAVRFLGRTPSTLASLDFPVPLDDLVDIPHGLVVVCGATGSGKSTTVAALAQEALRRRSVVLVSIEDPVEYVLSPGERSIVRQREIGRDVPRMADALREALREDPDILVVGEMRDEETISLALRAAETGHLVIGTLHSGSAASAIDRLVNAFGPQRQSEVRAQVAESLRAVVAQRLLPRAKGSGRCPALEVLRMNHAAASLVRESKVAQLSTVMQAGRREGMISLERCLADRVLAGDIKPEAARAAANDPAALASLSNR